MKTMTEKNDPARVVVGSKWRRNSVNTLTFTGLHEKVDRLTRMVERLLAREDQAPKGPA